MRGAGEPAFEYDFSPGSDIMGQLIEGPKPAERMEFELFSWFAGDMELEYQRDFIRVEIFGFYPL